GPHARRAPLHRARRNPEVPVNRAPPLSRTGFATTKQSQTTQRPQGPGLDVPSHIVVLPGNQVLLQEARQDPSVDELEGRLAGAVMAASQDRDFVRQLLLAERGDEIL